MKLCIFLCICILLHHQPSPVCGRDSSIIGESLKVLGSVGLCKYEALLLIQKTEGESETYSFDMGFSQEIAISETLEGFKSQTPCVLFFPAPAKDNFGLRTETMLQLSNLIKSLHQSPSSVVVVVVVEIPWTPHQPIPFPNVSFPIDSNIFTLSFHPQDSFLAEMYRVQTLFIYKRIPLNRLPTLPPSSVGRRRNFHGENITAILRTDQPDWINYKGEGENIRLLGGFSIHLLWNLQAMLNFSIRSIMGDGLKTIGNQLGGTTFSLLQNGSADISLSVSSIVPFRASQLKFLQPTYSGIINCFFKQPTANSIRNIVTAPFNTGVWLALFGTWILLILIVKSSATIIKLGLRGTAAPHLQLQVKELGGNYAAKDYGGDVHAADEGFTKDIGMWAFTANCQKSWHLIPSSIPLRLMFLTGILCAVVSYVGYSGAITSTLTVTILPVQQFEDLKKYNFLFTVHELSEPFQNFLDLMIKSQGLRQKVLNVSTADEVAHLLDPHRPRAFLTYSDFFYPATLELSHSEDFICSQISKVEVSPVFYKSGMFLRKGSEFGEIFDHGVMIMKERGFNDRFVKSYEKKTIFDCGTQKGGTVEPITFSDVFTMLAVQCLGLVVSFILVTLEVLHEKWKKWKLGITQPS